MFTAYKLPLDVAQQCVKLTKDLGLNFGAIDLVQAKDGSVWFLENNANGQWGFIELATKQPIGRAVADFLRKSRAGNRHYRPRVL